MVAIESPLLVRYMAEFESGILEELEPLAPDWLETFVLPDYAMDRETRRAIGQLNFQLLGDRTFMPDADDPVRDYVYKSSNRDAYIAQQMGGGINVTGLFAPMLDRVTGRRVLSGATALEVLAPNLTAAPWEAVADFRAHPGSEDARAKFREYEQRAATEDPGDVDDFGKRVAQEIAADLVGALRDWEQVQPAEVAKEVGKTGVGVLPLAGQFMGAAASALDLAHKADRARTSWSAALMTLRGPARDTQS